MRFNQWFKRNKKSEDIPTPSPTLEEKEKAQINQGVYYLYLIIGAQVAIVFGLMAIITAFGTFIATPTWVFFAALVLGGAGLVYVYRKAKAKLRKMKEAFQRVDLSDRNYEISFMGGMFTMRVEQPPQRILLEAPSPPPVIDAETVEAPPEPLAR